MTTTTSSTPLPITSAFIHDTFATQCSRAQNTTFLRTGITPQIGHRVDLTIFLSNRDLPFRLSGKVTVVHPPPTWNNDSNSNTVWHPSISLEDSGPSRGSLVLSYILKKKLPKERTRRDGSIPDLNRIWERVVSDKAKEEMRRRIERKFGVVHGQRVVCEARLNFDYEMRRPTEQGPWPDHIPIDGRDIWRFILIADDSRSNIWRADPASFVNLGQDQRNRCWPWSDGDVLPFERQQRGWRGYGPKGALAVHVCRGPFGCAGEGRCHSFPAIAA